MAKMDEEVSRVSVEGSMSEVIHGSPFSFILFIFDNNTVDNYGKDAE